MAVTTSGNWFEPAFVCTLLGLGRTTSSLPSTGRSSLTRARLTSWTSFLSASSI